MFDKTKPRVHLKRKLLYKPGQVFSADWFAAPLITISCQVSDDDDGDVAPIITIPC